MIEVKSSRKCLLKVRTHKWCLITAIETLLKTVEPTNRDTKFIEYIWDLLEWLTGCDAASPIMAEY